MKEFSIWFVRLIAFPISSTWMNFALNLDSITKSQYAFVWMKTKSLLHYVVFFISLPFDLHRFSCLRFNNLSVGPFMREQQQQTSEICFDQPCHNNCCCLAHEYWRLDLCRRNVPIAQFIIELSTESRKKATHCQIRLSSKANGRAAFLVHHVFFSPSSKTVYRFRIFFFHRCYHNCQPPDTQFSQS